MNFVRVWCRRRAVSSIKNDNSPQCAVKSQLFFSVRSVRRLQCWCWGRRVFRPGAWDGARVTTSITDGQTPGTPRPLHWDTSVPGGSPPDRPEPAGGDRSTGAVWSVTLKQAPGLSMNGGILRMGGANISRKPRCGTASPAQPFWSQAQVCVYQVWHRPGGMESMKFVFS